MKNFIYIFCLLFISPLYARVYINVGQAKVKKSLVAVSPLVYTNSSIVQEHLKYGKNISSQIKQNLNSSGYFNLIPSGAFVENPKTRAVIPYPKHPKGFRWGNWKVIGAEFLILARYSVEGDQINMRIYMYDILLKKSIFKKEYESPISKRVSLAHVVCNDIIEYLTKKPGIFLTKIAAVRNFQNNKKEIFVMNWDGSDKKQMSFHRSVVMTPTWHPNGKSLAYTAFVYRRSLKGRRANILLYNFARKKRQIISSNYNTNLGADFFPSGREMLMAIPSKWGGMDIFKLSLRSKKAFPVRMGPRGAINVEPAIHPNGKKIIFSSDRTGKVMIHEMNRHGENVRRLTFTGQYNSTPDWSPDGKQIVFAGYSRGRFDIFIMNAEGPSNIKRLTTARARNGRWSNNESPSFSPDGRQIVFTSDRTGYNQLFTIHIDGSNLKRITFDQYNYKSPKWSPLIKRFFQH